MQGKEILKTQKKFYLTDVSLRYGVLGYNTDSVASSLENIVHLELCRRGYTVNIGKTSDGEIDFVAVRQNEKIYVQVTQEIRSEKTEKREYDRLLEIHDNYSNMFSRQMNLREEIMKALKQCTSRIFCSVLNIKMKDASSEE